MVRTTRNRTCVALILLGINTSSLPVFFNRFVWRETRRELSTRCGRWDLFDEDLSLFQKCARRVRLTVGPSRVRYRTKPPLQRRLCSQSCSFSPQRVTDHQTAATARPQDFPVPLARESVLLRSREGIGAESRVILAPRLPVFSEKRITMRTKFTVHHNEHVSSRPFEEVVNAFESAMGDPSKTLDLRRSQRQPKAPRSSRAK